MRPIRIAHGLGLVRRDPPDEDYSPLNPSSACSSLLFSELIARLLRSPRGAGSLGFGFLLDNGEYFTMDLPAANTDRRTTG
jgi:hypothetical protein